MFFIIFEVIEISGLFFVIFVDKLSLGFEFFKESFLEVWLNLGGSIFDFYGLEFMFFF